jgi:hypothetical protein
MKKLIVLIAALTAVLFIAGCVTSGPTVSDKLSEAKNSAPPGTLVGQGSAKEGSKEAAEKKAKDRALFALIKGMMFIANDLVDEAVTAGRIASADGTILKQNITEALSRSALNRVTKVDAGTIGKDEAWAVYYMTKDDVLKEIDAAVNSAKEKVSARNFNTNNFDAKYPIAASREWKN